MLHLKCLKIINYASSMHPAGVRRDQDKLQTIYIQENHSNKSYQFNRSRNKQKTKKRKKDDGSTLSISL